MTQPCGFWCQLIWQRMAHNPEVAGSNPAPRYVTILRPPTRRLQSFWGRYEIRGDRRCELERVAISRHQNDSTHP
jgi:hypothetical protein